MFIYVLGLKSHRCLKAYCNILFINAQTETRCIKVQFVVPELAPDGGSTCDKELDELDELELVVAEEEEFC